MDLAAPITKRERDELERFLDDYDRGRMPGTTIPSVVAEGMRRLLAEWVPPADERCSEKGCLNTSTWGPIGGYRWCEDHPADGSPNCFEWAWRYRRLCSGVEQAIGPQSGSFQEAVHRLKLALEGKE